MKRNETLAILTERLKDMMNSAQNSYAKGDKPFNDKGFYNGYQNALEDALIAIEAIETSLGILLSPRNIYNDN